jgi:hypothetical protein
MRLLCILPLIFLSAFSHFSRASPVSYSSLISTPPSPARAYSSGIPDASAAAPLYTLVKLGDEFPEAMCLDGSKGTCGCDSLATLCDRMRILTVFLFAAGAYYLLPAASPSTSSKWRIFFEGGGWCIIPLILQPMIANNLLSYA